MVNNITKRNNRIFYKKIKKNLTNRKFSIIFNLTKASLFKGFGHVPFLTLAKRGKI